MYASKIKSCPNQPFDQNSCCLKHHKQEKQCILNLGFNEHDWKHRPSCFKKSCECQNNLPAAPSQHHNIVFDNNNPVIFHDFNGSNTTVHPFWYFPRDFKEIPSLIPITSMQAPFFVATQMCRLGIAGHMFYVILYTSKNNQKEEKRAYLNAATAVSRRIHRQAVTHDSFDDSPADFTEGLSQLLSGIRAHMSSSIISPPLAHLLVCQDSRFKFSHDFAYLLVSQIEDHLEEKDTNFKLHYCKCNV